MKPTVAVIEASERQKAIDAVLKDALVIYKLVRLPELPASSEDNLNEENSKNN